MKSEHLARTTDQCPAWKRPGNSSTSGITPPPCLFLYNPDTEEPRKTRAKGCGAGQRAFEENARGGQAVQIVRAHDRPCSRPTVQIIDCNGKNVGFVRPKRWANRRTRKWNLE